MTGGPAACRRPPSAAAGRPLHAPALGVILVAACCSRLWGIKQGLPYSYNFDEATHFVPRAIAFFCHDLNPHYFLNPPAYSYLLHLVLELWFGSGDAVRAAYTSDPTAVFVVARVVAAVLGTVAVWLDLPRRRAAVQPQRRAAGGGDLRASPSCPSSTAIWPSTTCRPWPGRAGAVRGRPGCVRRGRLRDYVIGGVGHRACRGDQVHRRDHRCCACSAAVVLRRPRAARGRSRPRGLALAASPCWRSSSPTRSRSSTSPPSRAGLCSRPRWPAARIRSSSGRHRAAASPTTCGRSPGGSGGGRRWPRSGRGAAAGPAADRARARPAPAPIAFIIFMGDQQRFFGRWLMPIFPLVAILAALRRRRVDPRARSRAPACAPRSPRRWSPSCSWPRASSAVIHTDDVLSRPTPAA